MFTRGWGGEGERTKIKYPVLQALARSGADVTLRGKKQVSKSLILSSNGMGQPRLMLKIGRFGILEIYPKFTRAIGHKHLEIHLKACRRRFREFGAISGTYLNPPCYGPGFLLKIGQLRALTNSPEIHTNHPASSLKSICKHVGGVSGSLERFPVFTKIRHVPKPWATAQGFCSKLGNFGPLQIHPKSTRTIPQAVRNPFESM